MKPIPDLRRNVIHFLALLSPPACPGCHRPAGRHGLSILCTQCRPRFRARTICRRCGRQLQDLPALTGYAVQDCLACRHLDPYFDVARSLAPYAGAWQEAIRAFKSAPQGDLLAQLANLLRRLLAHGLPDHPWAGIVPVPARLRGSTHPANILARRLSQRTRLPYLPILKFQKPTQPQRTLNRKERLANMHHALRPLTMEFKGQSLLVVDDVMTTGATVNECARALKSSGVARVGVLTLARGQGEFRELRVER